MIKKCLKKEKGTTPSRKETFTIVCHTLSQNLLSVTCSPASSLNVRTFLRFRSHRRKKKSLLCLLFLSLLSTFRILILFIIFAAKSNITLNIVSLSKQSGKTVTIFINLQRQVEEQTFFM